MEVDVAEKKTKLYELLAVEADLNNKSKAMLAEAQTTFTKKAEHFVGQSRSVSYFDEARQGENVSETKPLVSTVPERLEYTLTAVGKYWDALLQKELANQSAKADLVVEGGPTIKDLPATFLLAMETRLEAVRAVLLTVPTLDPNIDWHDAPDEGRHVKESPPKATFTTEKVLEYKTVAPATDKHPAQVKEWTSDVKVARIETIVRSGAITPAEKSDMLLRVDALVAAVKQARSRANGVEIENRKIANELVGFLLEA